MERKQAVIIGAGPAGLTAAYEFVTRTDIRPIVLEKSKHIGGLACTHEYKGNRIDLGGHRFFSKSDRVMKWWLKLLPLQRTSGELAFLRYKGNSRPFQTTSEGPDPEDTDAVMLLRRRKSRIYFLRQFFEYPLRLNFQTLAKLGFRRAICIVASYAKVLICPPPKIDNLEEFFIGRFGRELYETFFKSYTEKVWGIACHQISADWGKQRIKGLSVSKTLAHAVKQLLQLNKFSRDKSLETSLIESFLYPKFGPGQMWEEVARLVQSRGGEILTQFEVEKVLVEGCQMTAVIARDSQGIPHRFDGNYVFSTMPIKELVQSLDTQVPGDIQEISDRLMYRDFIIVGILLKQLSACDGQRSAQLIEDNWIYLQEPGVIASRIQIFNNWSPYMVADSSKVWIGVEYVCSENDELWHKTDEATATLAIGELEKIGMINAADVLDHTVIRTLKAYPAYFGAYCQFGKLKDFLDSFQNLYLLGRNGMHKYNNQDHSMLTAMIAVDNIVEGREDKSNLWAVNTEMEFHDGIHVADGKSST